MTRAQSAPFPYAGGVLASISGAAGHDWCHEKMRNMRNPRSCVVVT